MSDKDKLVYDPKTKKLFNPAEKSKKKEKIKAKKKALKEKFHAGKKDIDREVLKSLHGRINRAETEEEAQKLEKRLKKYKEMFNN